MPVLPDALPDSLPDDPPSPSEACRRVAGGVAHRLNNALFPMLGQIELLRIELRGGGRALPLLDQIEAAARRAATLSRSLLVMSGGLPPRLERVGVEGLLQGVSFSFQAGLPRTIRLAQAIAPELPEVMADPGQLEEALLGLLRNAREAIGAGPGRIELRARRWAGREPGMIALCPLPEGPGVAISVRDTGAGVPPEIAARLLDPFFSTRGEERGMGLALVAGTMLAHRGGVALRSAPGDGAELTLILPLPDPADEVTQEEFGWAARSGEEAPAAEGDPATGAARRALVVEDDDDLRALCCQVLEMSGLAAEGAASGEEAVQRAGAGGRWELIVLDLTLPGMGGREALERLRAGGAVAPGGAVLLCSGYDEARARELIGLPVDGYLPKPWRIRDMQRCLGALFGSAGA